MAKDSLTQELFQLVVYGKFEKVKLFYTLNSKIIYFTCRVYSCNYTVNDESSNWQTIINLNCIST